VPSGSRQQLRMRVLELEREIQEVREQSTGRVDQMGILLDAADKRAKAASDTAKRALEEISTSEQKALTAELLADEYVLLLVLFCSELVLVVVVVVVLCWFLFSVLLVIHGDSSLLIVSSKMHPVVCSFRVHPLYVCSSLRSLSSDLEKAKGEIVRLNQELDQSRLQYSRLKVCRCFLLRLLLW
jgi:hypothetical protein